MDTFTADCRKLYDFAYENFAIYPYEAARLLVSNKAYARGVWTSLCSRNLGAQPVWVNGREEVWQCARTYDDTTRAEHDAAFNKAFGLEVATDPWVAFIQRAGFTV